MKLRTVISTHAEADIQAAHDWWAVNRSAVQAARWYNDIYDAMDSLGDDPQRYLRSVESDQFPFELREKLFGLGRRPTHRILYTIRPEFVYVLAVRHVAQDALTPEDV